MSLLNFWRRLWTTPAPRLPVLTTQPPSTFGPSTLIPPHDGVPDYVAALTAALQRRPRERHQLRSLITVESTLRFAPKAGLTSLGDGVLIRALQALETFDELSTDSDLLRLERRMRRCLADRQAARLRAEDVDVPLDTDTAPNTTMTPGMAAALRALREGDRNALRRAGAPPPAPVARNPQPTSKW